MNFLVVIFDSFSWMCVLFQCVCLIVCLVSVFLISIVQNNCLQNENTALLLATEKGEVELMKLLLERGANTEVVNNVNIILSVSSTILFLVWSTYTIRFSLIKKTPFL